MKVVKNLTLAFGGYFLVLFVSKYGFLTFITFTFSMRNARLQDISDALSQNILFWLAFSALTTVFLLNLSRTREVIARNFTRGLFVMGAVRGAVIAISIAAAFITLRTHAFIGVFQEFPNLLLKSLLIFTLFSCEEWLFRNKIFSILSEKLGHNVAIFGTTSLALLMKAYQFDLGLSDFLFVGILNLYLCLRISILGDISYGIGFVSSLLIVIHAIFGMPIFGIDGPGIALVQFRNLTGEFEYFSRLISGGIGGATSSIFLQFLLILEISLLVWKQRVFFRRQLIQ